MLARVTQHAVVALVIGDRCCIACHTVSDRSSVGAPSPEAIVDDLVSLR
ncbi:MAG: hypothetical protein AAF480_16700 [Actinomycetota bacterium]